MRQEWEYCVVGLEQDGMGMRRVIIYLNEDEPRQEILDPHSPNMPFSTMFTTHEGQLLARLGREGWELVHVTSNWWYYFKRPKR